MCRIAGSDSTAAKEIVGSAECGSIYRGKPYVPFDMTTLDGKHLTNAICKGKVVFIDLWFESCRGCREEFGKLNELYDSLKQNAQCVFVSVTFDAPATIPEFMSRYGLHYPVAAVSEEESRRMGYHQAYPGKIILDKEGNVVLAGMLTIDDKDRPGNPGSITVSTLLKRIHTLEMQ